MKNNNSKSSIVLLTLLSALLFCSMIVVGSLSPLADFGTNTNQFGDIGMWSAIGFVLILYLLPLILFVYNVPLMKWIMATFCGVGLLINISILLLTVTTFLIDLVIIEVMILAITSIIVNLIFLPLAFRSSSKTKTILKGKTG